MKTVFGKQGTFSWRDSVSLCVHHPKHAPFFVRKLWSYFIPVPPDARRKPALEQLYRNGFEVRPVLDAILRHPALYTGPRMVKPPVVYIAGLLRGLSRGIDTSAWVWLSEGAGQRLFNPPNVAGWDDCRWLDTNAFRGRWYIANTALEKVSLGEKKKQEAEGPERPRGDRGGRARRARQPDDPARDPARAPRVRARLAEGRDGLEGRVLSTARRQRGPPAPRRLPRPPDLLMACCDEHSRAELLRRGLAEAGRGLPAIEPGMPMPAGTGLDRRTSSPAASASHSPSTVARR